MATEKYINCSHPIRRTLLFLIYLGLECNRLAKSTACLSKQIESSVRFILSLLPCTIMRPKESINVYSASDGKELVEENGIEDGCFLLAVFCNLLLA